MAPLLTMIREVLQGRGHACRLNDSLSRLEFSIEGDAGRWPCVIERRAALLVLVSHLPLRVPAHKRALGTDFVERVNAGLPTGKFHFELGTGFWAFISDILVEELENATDCIPALLEVHTHLANKYLPALTALCLPGEIHDYVLASVEGRFLFRMPLESSARW